MNVADLKFRKITVDGSEDTMMVDSLVMRMTGVDCTCVQKIARKGKPPAFNIAFWMTDGEFEDFQRLFFQAKYGDLDGDYEKLLSDNV